jgi:flavin reductase (DIM6/NTAB) family NADH-FMN oxidoreductase RutF
MPRTISGRAVVAPRGGLDDESQLAEVRKPAGNLDPLTLRRALSNRVTGVAVVTTRTDEGLRGITVSSFTSVSLEPPLVLVCIDHASQSHDWIAEAGMFAINILSDRQEMLAERFASRAPLVDERFEDVPHQFAVTGAPILDGCLAWLDCHLWARYDGGDHTVFVGQVKAAGVGPAHPPLIYFHSNYAHLQAP